MKELQENKALQPGQEEIRQVPTGKRKLGEFRLPPGVYLWEMIAVKDPEDPNPGPVKGLNPDGSFDPELAEIRLARFTAGEANFAPAEMTIASLNFSEQEINIVGPIEAGAWRRLIVVDGNFYIDASNKKNARRKIIARYFEPNKTPANESFNPELD